MRIGVAAAVVIACLGMSACSGATDGGAEASTEPSETETAPSSATPQEEATGKRATRSVASFVLPEGMEYTKVPPTVDSKSESYQWSVAYPGTDEPSCLIGLSIESDVGDNAVIHLLDEAKQMRKKNLQTAKMDPNTPEDVVGTVVRYAGVWETEDGKQKAASISRQWQTPGNTLIGLAINANDDAPKQCDPEAIAATLEWNGQERPVEETS